MNPQNLTRGGMEKSRALSIVRAAARLHFSITHLLETDGGEDVEAVIMSALGRYCISNPLHPDVFPGEYHVRVTHKPLTNLSSCAQDGGRGSGNVP